MTELYIIKFCKHALPCRWQENMKWENEIILELDFMYYSLDKTANGFLNLNNL